MMMKKMNEQDIRQASGGAVIPEEGWTPTNPKALASECPCFKERPDELGNCEVKCRNCIYCVGGGFDYWCQKGQVL